MIKKILLSVLGVLVVLLLGGFAYIETTYKKDFSKEPFPKIQASQDPQVIAQGEYVANALAHCSACHGPDEFVSQRKLGPKHDLRGGYALKAGPFGTFRPANITPDPDTGVGKVTDGQLARSIRHGVDRDGRLAAFMALAVGNMSDEDLTAVVSYLRSVPAVKNPVGPSEWGIIAKAMSGVFLPRHDPPIQHVASGTISVARGEYIANGPGFCVGCHTPMDMMTMKPAGAKFSGEGMAEPDPSDDSAELIVPNLTPDPETGVIAGWTEDRFVDRLRKQGRVHKGSKMPWENFAQMTEEDVRSVYRYLVTLSPAKHVTGPSWRKKGWKPAS